ncbi:MAG: fibronectin type III domain-containing protein [Pirellulales bacterium]|nr:fibronectin type III domain-containing protein [Pirellulales bacterium]
MPDRLPTRVRPFCRRWLLSLLLVACAALRLHAADVTAKPSASSLRVETVGTQPHGGFSGKIVYAHGGHGITADNKKDGRWSFQRGEGHEMIEDLGNFDQMTLLVDYLFRAGATVVPLRPVGHQICEVVMDNDDPGVTFEGAWTDGKGPIYFGQLGEVPYRQARSSRTETAHARYRPHIPATGFYPVYAWTSSGKDRAIDQLYRIHYSGGASEVNVNHRGVGNGLVYLGTYYFVRGNEGFVEISNRSQSAEGIVVADMIRFGNGLGDIDRGGGVSGLPREDEAGLYWVKWHTDRAQGIAESDYRETDVDRQATISLSPRYAAFMNAEGEGRLKDRVFVSFHSNASGGKARGVLGLFNGNNDRNTATPNQLLLAKSLAQEVNDDLVEQDGQFEHRWHNRKKDTTLDRDDIEFGEINNRYIHDEFDATIVEVAFHDNKLDAQLMRDARVRDAIARATYQGLLNYFRAVDNNETPATRLPSAVTGLHASTTAPGSITISWTPPESNSYLGDTATGYRVFVSTNGYGFDGGLFVAGGNTTSATLATLDPQTIYYFKVAAVNAGGQSTGSEVVAALPSGGSSPVLIVNGFDRLDRGLAFKQRYGKRGNTVDRVRPRSCNSLDYVVQAATAIAAAAPEVPLESASNEAVLQENFDLTKYRAIVWMLGNESAADHTFDAAEQAKIKKYIDNGGNLFVSGAELGWDLDHENGGRKFLQETLRAKFAADDADTHEAIGIEGSIFANVPKFAFDDGTLFYDTSHPDVFAPSPGGMAALNYANSAGAAAVQVAGTDGHGSVVILGFPFETITDANLRADLMKRVLAFFSAK